MTVLAFLAAAGMPNTARAQCEFGWKPGEGPPGLNSFANAMTVWDDGTGPALYVGGMFTTAGGVTVNRIARWDGQEWSPLGSGMNGWVHALTVFDDGSGPALYAGGEFTTAGGVTVNRIARWDGQQWSSLGSGMMSGGVYALTVFDDGTGEALYAGGSFLRTGTLDLPWGVQVNRIARWDGQQWSSLGNGMGGSKESRINKLNDSPAFLR